MERSLRARREVSDRPAPAFEDYRAKVLEEEVLAREASGGRLRVRAARLLALKTLDDFDCTVQRSRPTCPSR